MAGALPSLNACADNAEAGLQELYDKSNVGLECEVKAFRRAMGQISLLCPGVRPRLSLDRCKTYMACMVAIQPPGSQVCCSSVRVLLA